MSRPSFRHVVITRFSVRSIDVHSPSGRSTGSTAAASDPLDPESLELRFRLFEMTCLPSVLAQTNAAFAWVLVVDAALPVDARRRLTRLIGGRPDTVLHTHDPALPITDTAWLAPLIGVNAPEYLLTTSLDDDDALPRKLVEDVHESITEKWTRLAPVELFGASDAWQWDLQFENGAPMGYRARWHRPVPVVAAGFTLVARFPAYSLTVLGLSHVSARRLLDWERHVRSVRAARDRTLLGSFAASAGDSLRDYPAAETFHDTTVTSGLPVVTNHAANSERGRLDEPKDRVPVVGPGSFPDCDIDWNAVDRHSASFRSRP